MPYKHVIPMSIILGAFIIGFFYYVATLQKYEFLQRDYSNTPNPMITSPSPNTSHCQAKENTMVTKVIDGDTVVVEGGYHVRLLGIDADEKGYPCYEQAKHRLENLVLNKQVRLERDIADVDQYRRCLRDLFSENQNVDVTLVREGLAIARFYEPNIKYRDEIQAAEKQAIGNNIGCKWISK